MYQKVAESGRATADAVETLRRSSPISVPGKIKVPTLLLQGQRDSLFTLGQADANAKAIAATGAPVEVAWFDGGHDGGNGEVDWLHDRTLGWFDRHLKESEGAGQAGGAFTVTRDGGRDPGTRRPVQLHAVAGGYPGLSGTGQTSVPLSGSDQQVANPPGGSPSSISAVPGFGGLGGGATANLSIDMAGQSATFDSPPLATPLQVTGSSTVRVRVTPEQSGSPATADAAPGDAATGDTASGDTAENGAAENGSDTGSDSGSDTGSRGETRAAAGDVTLFAKLYDVAGATQAPILPEGLVAPVRITIPEGGSGEATVTLPAIDHRFDVGHRLRVAFTPPTWATAPPRPRPSTRSPWPHRP